MKRSSQTHLHLQGPAIGLIFEFPLSIIKFFVLPPQEMSGSRYKCSLIPCSLKATLAKSPSACRIANAVKVSGTQHCFAVAVELEFQQIAEGVFEEKGAML